MRENVNLQQFCTLPARHRQRADIDSHYLMKIVEHVAARNFSQVLVETKSGAKREYMLVFNSSG